MPTTTADKAQEPCAYNEKLQVTVPSVHLNMIKELAHLSDSTVSATASLVIRDWLVDNYEKMYKFYGGNFS